MYIHNKLTVLAVTVLILCSSATAQSETFSDIAKVATPTCSNDQSQIENCHDDVLPEAPSITRTAIGAGKHNDSIVDFPDGEANTDSTYILPLSSTTNDGRLILYGDSALRPAFRVFRPENIGDDHKVKGDGLGAGEELYSQGRSIMPVLMLHPTRSNLDYSQSVPLYNHHSMCDDSSTAFDLSTSNSSDRNPRFCTAKVSPNGGLTYSQSDNIPPPYIPGDLVPASEAVDVDGNCYDISVMAGAQDDTGRWEMVANKFTIFIEDINNTLNGTNLTSKPLIYPRMSGEDLPFYGSYNISNAHYQPATKNFSWSFEYARNRMIDECIETTTIHPPNWCKHYDDMQTSADHGTVMDVNANGIAEGTEYWDGRPGTGRNMFEPTITGDGRLLVINGDTDSAWYGYTPNACEISGWKNLRPISAMPWDSRINNRYPIARAQKNANGSILPFRDSQGQLFENPTTTPGARLIAGSYPWIDREGRNIFMSRINDFRDHYTFRNITQPCAADEDCSYEPDIANTIMSPDSRPGKGVSVIGAWTRGKVVHLDYRINFSDFGNIGHNDPNIRFNGDNMPAFDMPLFQNESVYFQAKASQSIQSIENVFNHYNALSPRLPFDVVWTVSTDVAQNSEVVFDEYMLDNAFIVAHMNSPITSFNCGASNCPPFADDGFTPTNPDKSERIDGDGTADFRFTRTPKIQNASTLVPANSCPAGTTKIGTRCEFSSWDNQSASLIFHSYNANDMELRITDFRISDNIFALCPPNTSLNGFEFPGGFFGILVRKCGVNIPDGYTHSDAYVYANSLVVNDVGDFQIMPPNYLSALGGARTQPLALGGVIGKGLWLDGINDNLEARFETPNVDDWFAGVWLDNRAQDDVARTVFKWSDGSRIAISNNYITANLKGTNGTSKTIPIANLGLQNNEYFHFGVKSIYIANKRILYFYINGTRLAQSITFQNGTKPFNLSHQSSSNTSGFWLGDAHNENPSIGTFRGWVDELRVYALTNREMPNNSYFEESICNLAMGSLVHVAEGDEGSINASLRQLHQRAQNYGLLNPKSTSIKSAPVSATVCEQLNIGSHEEPADFAPQAPSDAICADRVHKNPHPVFSDRCMRTTRHGIKALPILANNPRPDFSNKGFCLSCHADTNALEELNLEALTAGVHERYKDERRQPMDVPAVLSGCTPAIAPFTGSCYGANNPLIMDYLFDFNNKLLPY